MVSLVAADRMLLLSLPEVLHTLSQGWGPAGPAVQSPAELL